MVSALGVLACAAVAVARAATGPGGGVIQPRKLENLTVYRVTPVNLTGIADRNSGDAAGDVFFTLYEAILPVYCPQNPMDSICNITSTVLGDTNRNVYRQSIIEVDANYGIYNGCDPQSDYSVQCHPYQRGPVCWYNTSCGARSPGPDGDFVGAIGPFCLANPHQAAAAAKEFEQSFAPLCSRAQCSCEAELTGAVGKWPCVFCRPDDGPPHAQTRLWDQINKMTQTLNPTWYSTRALGECGAGDRPGTGSCFWREVKLLRNANASCVRNRFLRAIADHNRPCYDTCPQPANISTPCYVECMLDSIVGTADGAVPPMSRAELVGPYTRAFRSTDPNQGGCPEVPV